MRPSRTLLIGDMGTGNVESAPMDYGPSISAGTVYTDVATIKAVQQSLISKGYPVGKTGADGVFGKDTEAALFKFSGKHGPPDDATLNSLGVVSPTERAAQVLSSAKTPAQAQAAAAQMTAAAPPALKAQAQEAQAAVAAAKTPEELQAAKKKVQAVADKAQGGGSFLTNEAFAGLVWWQVILGGVGTIAIGAGIASLFAGKRK